MGRRRRQKEAHLQIDVTEEAFRLLGKACQSSVGWRGERGEAEAAAADILARTSDA